MFIVYYRTLENAEAKKKAREVFKNNKDILENAGFKTGAQFVTDEDLKQGLILDVKAAKILSDKGIDVGFLKIESAPKPAGEYFFAENDSTAASTEREGEKLHLGLFNLSKDKIKNPEVTVDKMYKELDCFNCKGSINGRKIRL